MHLAFAAAVGGRVADRKQVRRPHHGVADGATHCAGVWTRCRRAKGPRPVWYTVVRNRGGAPGRAGLRRRRGPPPTRSRVRSVPPRPAGGAPAQRRPRGGVWRDGGRMTLSTCRSRPLSDSAAEPLPRIIGRAGPDGAGASHRLHPAAGLCIAVRCGNAGRVVGGLPQPLATFRGHGTGPCRTGRCRGSGSIPRGGGWRRPSDADSSLTVLTREPVRGVRPTLDIQIAMDITASNTPVQRRIGQVCYGSDYDGC